MACGSKTPISPSPTPALAITCPANASARADVGAAGAAVTFSPPTATGGKAPLTTTCTPQSGTTFPVGSTTVSCTASDTAGQSAQCTFSVVVNPGPVPRLAYTKYLGFGDSQTEGKISKPQELMPNSYTLKLQPMLQARYTAQTIVVADDGLGGQAVEDPGTYDRFRQALFRETPEVVLIMDGANDLIDDTPDIPATIDAMRDLGVYATSKGVQVFLATLPPMNPATRPAAPLVAPYNAQLVSLAASKNWTLVDVNAAFHGDLSLIGADGLHPTDAGYQVIAQAFYEKIAAKYDQTATASYRASAGSVSAWRAGSRLTW